MKKQEEKEIQMPLSVEQARKIIENYFGIHHYKIDDLHYAGSSLHVTIQYYDFKPERTVRDYLEQQIPYLNATVYRDISEGSMVKEMQRAWNEAEQITFLYDGELLKFDFHEMVASWLQDKPL